MTRNTRTQSNTQWGIHKTFQNCTDQERTDRQKEQGGKGPSIGVRRHTGKQSRGIAEGNGTRRQQTSNTGNMDEIQNMIAESKKRGKERAERREEEFDKMKETSKLLIERVDWFEATCDGPIKNMQEGLEELKEQREQMAEAQNKSHESLNKSHESRTATAYCRDERGSGVISNGLESSGHATDGEATGTTRVARTTADCTRGPPTDWRHANGSTNAGRDQER